MGRFTRAFSTLLTAALLAAMLASCGANGPAKAPTIPPVAPACVPPATLPVLPLHTLDRWIVDSNNRRVKLTGVNWYGAEELDYVVAGLELADLNQIVTQIQCMGFNSVRIPWSNEMYERNPIVSDRVLAANPQLKGLHALDVLDAVVSALARQGLLVILDNHVSRADWCCSNTDGNQLWYNDQYPETNWIADWQGMVRRYKAQPAVVAADLRNELRATATWGGNPLYDWHGAAERGGNAVLDANPNLLVIVEGVNYAGDLTGVAGLPISLRIPNRLVYSSHDYFSFHQQNGVASFSDLQQQLDNHWGYILEPGHSYTAPVWVGEFGTCHSPVSCLQDSTPNSQGFWFSNFVQYQKQKDTDWCYWPLNGTQASGTSRTFDAEEGWGILDITWRAPAAGQPSLLETLQTIIPASQGPGR